MIIMIMRDPKFEYILNVHFWKKERGCYSLNWSRSTTETWKHNRDAGKNKNTQFLNVLLPGSTKKKKKMLWIFLTHSKILSPGFTETPPPPPLALCIIPVARKQINNCTHDRRHHLLAEEVKNPPQKQTKKKDDICQLWDLKRHAK